MARSSKHTCMSNLWNNRFLFFCHAWQHNVSALGTVLLFSYILIVLLQTNLLCTRISFSSTIHELYACFQSSFWPCYVTLQLLSLTQRKHLFKHLFIFVNIHLFQTHVITFVSCYLTLFSILHDLICLPNHWNAPKFY